LLLLLLLLLLRQHLSVIAMLHLPVVAELHLPRVRRVRSRGWATVVKVSSGGVASWRLDLIPVLPGTRRRGIARRECLLSLGWKRLWRSRGWRGEAPRDGVLVRVLMLMLVVLKLMLRRRGLPVHGGRAPFLAQRKVVLLLRRRLLLLLLRRRGSPGRLLAHRRRSLRLSRLAMGRVPALLLRRRLVLLGPAGLLLWLSKNMSLSGLRPCRLPVRWRRLPCPCALLVHGVRRRGRPCM
jgi:hypothetical protein